MSVEAFNKVIRGLVEEVGPDEAYTLLREVFRRKPRARVYMEILQGPTSVPEIIEHGVRANPAYEALYGLWELGLLEVDDLVNRFPVENGGRKATVWRLKI